jgi:hypothetical protein
VKTVKRAEQRRRHPRKITDCKGYGTHPHKKNKRPKEKLILWHRALTHGRGEEEGSEDDGGHAAPAAHDAHHIADVEGEEVVRCSEHGDQLQPRARTPSAPRRGGPGCQQERSSLGGNGSRQSKQPVGSSRSAMLQAARGCACVRMRQVVAGVRGSYFC